MKRKTYDNVQRNPRSMPQKWSVREGTVEFAKKQ